MFDSFLQTAAAEKWKKIGLEKRSGIAVPLFTIHSLQSTGVGEIPDLKLLVDWCKKGAMSIIQLLPLNDTGYRFTPYDSESTFALEPVYLRLSDIRGVNTEKFRSRFRELRDRFKTSTRHVDYRVKAEKLKLLREMFEDPETRQEDGFAAFCRQHRSWLEDYALFKTLKEDQQQKAWMDWPRELRERRTEALEKLRSEHAERIRFHEWVQYQLFEQFSDVRRYARSKGVFLMGDLPFLVSRDSADVWANPHAFKTDRLSGAPPDLYFADGQRWGMPPYNWEEMAENDFDYLRVKLSVAERLYDMYRIDHVVGVFRIWTIDQNEPSENGGRNGEFDPADESLWEEQGRRLLGVMLESSGMLPCAEDLGTVPDCSWTVLREMGIPGMDVQRWLRDWDGSGEFTASRDYRELSIGVLSTHDMSPFRSWWDREAGTADKGAIERAFVEAQLDFAALSEHIFDTAASPEGRLRWRGDIQGEEDLLGRLKTGREEARAVLDSFRSGFREREKFLESILADGDPALAAGASCTPDLVEAAVRAVQRGAPVFSIQLILDLLCLDEGFIPHVEEFQFNFPGTFGDQNWSARLPYSLEKMLEMDLTGRIQKLNIETGRALNRR